MPMAGAAPAAWTANGHFQTQQHNAAGLGNNKNNNNVNGNDNTDNVNSNNDINSDSNNNNVNDMLETATAALAATCHF